MCDLDPIAPSAYTSVWRTARKEHRCCVCEETISTGDLYHYLSGIWDGRADSHKHCARCWKTYLALVERSEGGVDIFLNCGETYDGNDPSMLELAFMTPAEAQAWARQETTP